MTGFISAVATKGQEAPIPTARFWLKQETENLARPGLERVADQGRRSKGSTRDTPTG